MRRFTHVISTLILSIAIVACGGAAGDNGGTDPTDPTPEETYDASGVITDQDANTLEGVTLTIDGADIDEFTVTTDTDGTWTATGLTGEVTVTPELSGYIFNPASRDVQSDTTDADFTAQAVYAAAGTVLNANNDPVANVTIELQFSGNTEEVKTNEDGEWEYTSLYGDATITPTDPAFDFSPDHENLTQAETNVDFEGTIKRCNGNTDGTSSNPCEITRVEQLQMMGDLAYLGDHYVLGGDIDATDTENWNAGSSISGFIPIGTNTSPFNGTLNGDDGNGGSYAITGLYISASQQNYIGLFGYLDSNAEVSNIDVLDAYVFTGTTSGTYTGGVAGVNDGTVDTVTFSGEVRGHSFTGGLIGQNSAGAEALHLTNDGLVLGREKAGGIIGNNQGTVLHAENTGVVNDSQHGEKIGGVVGHNHNGGTVEEAHNTGEVQGNKEVGGVIGHNEADATELSNAGLIAANNAPVGGIIGKNSAEVTEAVNFGTVEIGGNGAAGGVVGENTSPGELSHVRNDGVVQTKNGQAGGIVGSNISGTVEHAVNTGSVNSTDAGAGGIAGTNANNGTVRLSANTGNISGASGVGGIIGKTSNSTTLVETSFNTGTITSTGNNAGGIVGEIGNDATIKDAYNLGTVSGDKNVGGIAGFASSHVEPAIQRTYSFSNLTALAIGTNPGGILGDGDAGDVEDSYYHNTASTNTLDGGGIYKVADNLRKEATFDNWDFNTIWDIDEGNHFPDLRNNSRF